MQETQEKPAKFVMPKKTNEIKDAVQEIDDPLEYYEVTHVEFPQLPVVVSWDGGGPETRSNKDHYRIGGNKIKRWSLTSGKIHQIPRSLADYLNDLSVPDPETTVNPSTGQVINEDPGHRRKRFSCILKRNYVPPVVKQE